MMDDDYTSNGDKSRCDFGDGGVYVMFENTLIMKGIVIAPERLD